MGPVPARAEPGEAALLCGFHQRFDEGRRWRSRGLCARGDHRPDGRRVGVPCFGREPREEEGARVLALRVGRLARSGERAEGLEERALRAAGGGERDPVRERRTRSLGGLLRSFGRRAQAAEGIGRRTAPEGDEAAHPLDQVTVLPALGELLDQPLERGHVALEERALRHLGDGVGRRAQRCGVVLRHEQRGLAGPADRTRVRAHEPLDAVAAVGVAAALSSRHCLGVPLLKPDAQASHAADLLRLIRGDRPDRAEVDAFETYLVAALDHGLNASTFTARVVASTQAGMQASILAAFCALTGPLHGGAPGPVLDMLDAIEESGDAAEWIANELASGRRLMGFGHRIYRVRDPRADVLKASLKKLGKIGRLERAEQIEQEAITALSIHKSGRRLDVNTEFYTALLLETLKIPRQCFTSVFAAARVAGWVAHIREEEAVGRLIRPRSQYLGKMPKRAA